MFHTIHNLQVYIYLSTSFVFIFTGLSSDSCLLIANMLRYEHRISRHFNATITRKLFRIFYHIGSRVMDCEHRQFSHTLDLYSQWILTTKIRASKGKKNILLVYVIITSMRKVDLSKVIKEYGFDFSSLFSQCIIFTKKNTCINVERWIGFFFESGFMLFGCSTYFEQKLCFLI